MRQLKIGAALVLFSLILSAGLGAQMMEQVVPGQVRVFQITVRQKGTEPGFGPYLVIVRPGDKVRLVITAVDSNCTFRLKEFHIHQELKKGVPTTINFTASNEGKFGFRCSGGMIHRDLKGTLVVQPSAKAAASGGGA